MGALGAQALKTTGGALFLWLYVQRKVVKMSGGGDEWWWRERFHVSLIRFPAAQAD